VTNVNLSAAWTTFWSAINRGQISTLLTIVTVIGLIVMVSALLGFVFKKRRGGGGDTKGLWWAIAIGALCSAPNVLIPVILKLIDLIVNIVLGAVNALVP